jgi:magnesium chelatase family protein
MTLAVVHTRAIDGLNAPSVRVQVNVAEDKPGFKLIGMGRADAAETCERVLAALAYNGLSVPTDLRVTITLEPIELPKEARRFDLPIALGILAAKGQVDPSALGAFEFVGELSTTGELLPVRGALALALAMRHEGSVRTLVLPERNASEAAFADRVDVRSASHLLDVVAALKPSARARPLVRALAPRAAATFQTPDMRDIRGQAVAKRVLEIAAAGNHHVLMLGPPSTAKSMLAERLRCLLPPMAENEALASAAIASLSGSYDPRHWMVRPHRAPHPAASAEALLGGGSPPRPGEFSLAYGGVFYVEDLPALPDEALEALPETLQSGRVALGNAPSQSPFPARFQLIAGMSACPCGNSGAIAGRGYPCRCDPDTISRYQSRLSKTLIGHIDLQVDVPAARHEELTGAPDGPSSSVVATRVVKARALQTARQPVWNANLDEEAIGIYCELDEVGRRLLAQSAQQLQMSRRSHFRVLKVARTIADLAGRKTIASMHLAEALQYRTALPAQSRR